MDDLAGTEVLAQGREAAARSDWPQAYDLLVRADQLTRLSLDDLGLLAQVAYASGHLEATIEAWERVHTQAHQAGDSLAAAGAACQVALHLLMDTALMAPVRGWVRRAERLLEGYDQTPVHAWVAVVTSYERLLMGDLLGAREWAGRAVAVGSSCNAAAAAIGRVAEAHAVILGGEVRRGLDLVDEAAVATVSGELDVISTGMVYCELVCMLQGLAQYDLAEEWTEAMERWRHGRGIGSVHGRCRVHRAEILRLRGAVVEAEQEALAACAELRPYLRREFGWPLTELGRVRLQVGDLRGAEEAFLEARRAGWDPEPGLALVRLARGDVALAAASIRDALDRPGMNPSKELPPNTELRRAPLLAAQAEIEAAAGDLLIARDAADELARVAATFQSKSLVASAAMADGRVRLAADDTSGARQAFQTAVELWGLVGAPYEAALARTCLAETDRVAGADVRAHSAPMATRQVAQREHESNVLHLQGDYWSVSFAGQTVAVRDLKGLHYLARLLADPGREFHVLDLVASGADPAASTAVTTDPELTPSEWGDSGPLLDARAKSAYRRRLTEIEEDLDDARLTRDDGRAAQAEAERDFLIRELSRAVGLGGRDRRAGSASERARVSVTRAIRHALSRIRQHHPPLGEHLDQAIRTGTYCVYLPDSRITPGWKG
jgi:tetratricopeptide (TPR) repeat protein